MNVNVLLSIIFLIFYLLGLTGIMPAKAAQPRLIAKASKSEKKISPLKPKRLIFLSFYNESQSALFNWVENSIIKWMHDKTKKQYSYEKISKEMWESYFLKNKYSKRDLFRVKKLRQMGKDIGVDGIIFGRFRFDEKKEILFIEGRILSVIDGEILAQKSVETPINATMIAAAETLSDYLAKRIKDLFVPTDLGAMWRTAILPGWGFKYKQRPYYGYTWAGLMGGSALFTLGTYFNYYLKKQDYLNYSPDLVITPAGETGLFSRSETEQKFQDLENKALEAKELALNSIYIFFSLYACNLLHAYLINADVGNTELRKGRIQVNPVASIGRGNNSDNKNHMNFQIGLIYYY